MSTDTRPPVYRRRRALVIAIVAYLTEQEHPTPWDDLLATFRTEGQSWKTLENVIRDLEAFGALHRIGRAGTKGKADTRALVATPLGRAWLDQELLPLPGHHEDDDDDEIPEDPFELADQIADTVADLAYLHHDDPLAP